MMNVRSTFTFAGGLTMPAVSLGTYMMDEAQAKAATLHALGKGYRGIDTAEGYKNETGIGKAIKESGIDRASIFVTTKLWPGNEQWGQKVKTYSDTIKCCEDSLKRLQLEYVDLYLIHAPFAFSSSFEAGLEQYRALIDLQTKGLCRNIGVSNFDIVHLEAIKDSGLELPATNQLELHPLCQRIQLIEFMKQHSILPTSYSSLAPLSSWRVGQKSAKPRLMSTQQDNLKTSNDVKNALSHSAKILSKVAKRVGVSEAKILLRWSLQKGYPVLPKSNNHARIEENIDLFHCNEFNSSSTSTTNLTTKLTTKNEKTVTNPNPTKGWPLTTAEMEMLDSLHEKTGDIPLAWSTGDPNDAPIRKI